MKPRFALGLDFGGTKLAAGVVHLETSRIVDSAFRSTRADAGAEGALADIIEMANRLQDITQIDCIGVCFGGHVVNNQIVKSLHVAGWDHFPIHERLQAVYGNVPVYLANDANAIALGEFRYGAGRGSRSMLFVTVSTGVGGGIILDGKLWEGAHGMSGEIGHTKAVAEGGQRCTCGRYGCVETISSGPAMVRRARALLSDQPELTSKLRQYPDFTAYDLDQLAAGGDPVAQQVIREGARYLGTAIGNAVNILDVDCVVIGGGVSRAGEIWWDALRGAAAETVMPQRPAVPLRPSTLAKDEGIWGAAALISTERN
jgi:glucokinase